MKTRKHGQFSPLNDVAGRFTPYLYVAPTLLVTVVFLLFPSVQIIWFSLTEWSGLGPKQFAGTANYVELFDDKLFWQALTTNLIYVFFFSLVPVALGVILSAIIGRTRVRGEHVFRAVLLVPQVVAPVAMGVIFGWIFAPAFGLVNDVLDAIGLDAWQQPWLGSPRLAPLSVGSVGSWLWLGFVTIVFVSGIQKISEDLYDAAKLDGANGFRQFLVITLPALRAEFVVVIIVTLIRAFGSSVFAVVHAITGGSYRTAPLSLLAYKLAFVQSRMGYGSAVIVLLMILVTGLSALAMRLGRER